MREPALGGQVVPRGRSGMSHPRVPSRRRPSASRSAHSTRRRYRRTRGRGTCRSSTCSHGLPVPSTPSANSKRTPGTPVGALEVRGGPKETQRVRRGPAAPSKDRRRAPGARLAQCTSNLKPPFARPRESALIKRAPSAPESRLALLSRRARAAAVACALPRSFGREGGGPQ